MENGKSQVSDFKVTATCNVKTKSTKQLMENVVFSKSLTVPISCLLKKTPYPRHLATYCDDFFLYCTLFLFTMDMCNKMLMFSKNSIKKRKNRRVS